MKKLNSRTVIAAVSAGALVAGGMVVPANAQSSNDTGSATLNGSALGSTDDSAQDPDDGNGGSQGSSGSGAEFGSNGGNIELALAIALGTASLGAAAWLATNADVQMPEGSVDIPSPQDLGLPTIDLPPVDPALLGGGMALGLGLALAIALGGGSTGEITGSTGNGSGGEGGSLGGLNLGSLTDGNLDLGSVTGSLGEGSLDSDSFGEGSLGEGSGEIDPASAAGLGIGLAITIGVGSLAL